MIHLIALEIVDRSALLADVRLPPDVAVTGLLAAKGR